jgi:hypothetical protein
MRGLFKWATKASLVKVDPTIGVEDPARPKGSGFPVWTEDQVAAYERRWPTGTRQRVWLDVLLYTGLRRGDAVRLGRQHVRNGIATLKTEKSGFELEVTLPILPVLAETLNIGPCGELAFIAGATGMPLSKRAFGNEFGRRVARPASSDRRMDFARSPRRALRMLAQPSRSLKRSLDGPAGAWRPSTRAPPIDAGWRSRRCTRWRTMRELLFPHLKVRCGRQKELTNDFKIKIRGCRGSDPRLLRLTMDALLDQHMWGATPCIKDRQRSRLDLPDVMWACPS